MTPIKNLRNWRVHLAIGVTLVLGVFLIAYTVIANSSAYDVAKRFVEASDSVRAVTGPIKSERLGVRNLRFNLSGNYGEMRFSMHVTGELDTAEVAFLLSRPQQAWQIDEAVLINKGKRVPLEIRAAKETTKP